MTAAEHRVLEEWELDIALMLAGLEDGKHVLVPKLGGKVELVLRVGNDVFTAVTPINYPDTTAVHHAAVDWLRARGHWDRKMTALESSKRVAIGSRLNSI